MNITPEQIEAGQAVYTKQTLAIYNFIVLGVSNRFLWKCPTQRLLTQYNQWVTNNHLDVGVGTGYFLDQCQFRSPFPRIALMDLNRKVLEFTSQKISRYSPETYCCNVLEPISFNTQQFDSIAINYLLHCLPGTIESKSCAFDYLKTLMNPNAVLFGSTILGQGVKCNWFAKQLMGIYNQKRIFSNQQDDLEGLERELKRRFKNVSVEIVGCVALFSGRV